MIPDPIYIYPQWLGAINKLYERLEPTPRQREILQHFFRNCIFEFGVDVTTDRHMIERAQIDIKAVNRDKARRMIVDKIFQKGMYLEQTTSFGFQEITRTTVLVCGVPLIVGPAEREKHHEP